MSQNGILKKVHLERVDSFVETYDRLYQDLAKLEEKVQELLVQQKAVVEELQATRSAENDFFETLATETGLDKSTLKTEAANWASSQKEKTFFTT